MSRRDFHIYYDISKELVSAKVINSEANLNEPTFFNYSTNKIKELLIKHECFSLLFDFSLIGINIGMELEYYYAKNIKDVFDYPEGTHVGVYEGEFYNDKKWNFVREIFKTSGINYIEYFGDYEETLDWLNSKMKQEINY